MDSLESYLNITASTGSRTWCHHRAVYYVTVSKGSRIQCHHGPVYYNNRQHEQEEVKLSRYVGVSFPR